MGVPSGWFHAGRFQVRSSFADLCLSFEHQLPSQLGTSIAWDDVSVAIETAGMLVQEPVTRALVLPELDDRAAEEDAKGAESAQEQREAIRFTSEHCLRSPCEGQSRRTPVGTRQTFDRTLRIWMGVPQQNAATRLKHGG